MFQLILVLCAALSVATVFAPDSATLISLRVLLEIGWVWNSPWRTPPCVRRASAAGP
ncbi:hypothetical protein [Streptomyces sp. NBC_00687]|uniref:hypothetical protein n=1 Tax=Streptomyces sp. NBC_00687 TaxID=2975807 RepID=UPI00224D89F5|nr:hypothetical protein [Streptomyces sp. NBC_00687]MCX4919048.1 hypothetical protein [Streptomyces sp. NBC_00687]